MNIIITGASRGIGKALVERLADNPDHTIIAIARSQDKLESLAHHCNARRKRISVVPLVFDLASNMYTELLLPAILKHIKKVDLLVNNAGHLINKPFGRMADSDFDALFELNVKSTFRMSRLLLPYMAKPSHIVNIGSMGGVQGSAKFPGLSLYSAAKGAVVVLTEAMAEELKEQGISVNCLAFGAVQTEMLAEAFPGYQAPLGAVQMADFVADFALNGHQYFNGKVLPVSSSTP